MQATCTHCGTQYLLKDADVNLHPRVQFHCSKCGKSTIVEIQRRPDATMVISPLPSFARANAASSNLHLQPEDDSLRLPATQTIVLTIVSGPDKGAVTRLKKARVVLGREGADTDIPVKDPEISRHHCLLEVRDHYVNLKDLDSTNGTFYEDERVRAAMLQNGSEFRIGETLIRVTFEPK